jgi:hypothetical protein
LPLFLEDWIEIGGRNVVGAMKMMASEKMMLRVTMGVS